MDRRQFVLAAGACAIGGEIAAATPPISAAATIADLAWKTRALYHDERLASRIAQQLEAASTTEPFRAASSTMALANLINQRIAAVSNDLHFMVMPGTMHQPPVPPTAPHSAPQPVSEAELSHLRSRNFGIREAVILPGKVGRLGISQFYRPAKEVRDQLGKAMDSLSGTSAMIVDLAGNPGGDPHSVALLLSYFFEREPFVVNRFRWRARPVEEFRTTADPGGPRYGERRPLVVAVSGSSFSAAEEFAYDIQALKRGLVIGEPTGGGANHALPVPIAGGFTAFIPEARAENPVTGTNWEGKGVQPDVAARAQDLATAAHRLALQQIAAATKGRDARQVQS